MTFFFFFCPSFPVISLKIKNSDIFDVHCIVCAIFVQRYSGQYICVKIIFYINGAIVLSFFFYYYYSYMLHCHTNKKLWKLIIIIIIICTHIRILYLYFLSSHIIHTLFQRLLLWFTVIEYIFLLFYFFSIIEQLQFLKISQELIASMYHCELLTSSKRIVWYQLVGNSIIRNCETESVSSILYIVYFSARVSISNTP